MIEVFKTQISTEKEARVVRKVLAEYLLYSNVTFDLTDCDKILRVISSEINSLQIINALEILEIKCEVLEDHVPSSVAEPIIHQK